MAHKLEDLPLFPKVIAFCDAVDAILARSAWRKDRRLHEQISDANDSITSNLYEGWEQPSDASFSIYVYRSKGSLAEVIARLKRGRRKRLVTADEIETLEPQAEELARMLGGFIKYLDASGFTDRGRHAHRTKQAGSTDKRSTRKPPDEGSGDAGSRDTGSRDAGSRDAGSRDTGSRDAGSRDTGSRDAGSRDAGSRDK